MAVSERDHDYMRRLGQFEAEAQAERLAEHLAQDLSERLRRSAALMRRFRSTAGASPRDDDDPTQLYDRARSLGLYRP